MTLLMLLCFAACQVFSRVCLTAAGVLSTRRTQDALVGALTQQAAAVADD